MDVLKLVMESERLESQLRPRTPEGTSPLDEFEFESEQEEATPEAAQEPEAQAEAAEVVPEGSDTPDVPLEMRDFQEETVETESLDEQAPASQSEDLPEPETPEVLNETEDLPEPEAPEVLNEDVQENADEPAEEHEELPSPEAPEAVDEDVQAEAASEPDVPDALPAPETQHDELEEDIPAPDIPEFEFNELSHPLQELQVPDQESPPPPLPDGFMGETELPSMTMEEFNDQQREDSLFNNERRVIEQIEQQRADNRSLMQEFQEQVVPHFDDLRHWQTATIFDALADQTWLVKQLGRMA